MRPAHAETNGPALILRMPERELRNLRKPLLGTGALLNPSLKSLGKEWVLKKDRI